MNENFLIVDGHNQMRTLVKQMLKNNAYKNYIIVDSGRDALNVIQKEKIDFIISGWDVPVINGMDLLKLVKGDPLLFSTPFVLISKKRSLKNIFYALEEGVEGYLILPFTESDFIKLIKKSLIESSRPDLYKLKLNQMIREKFNEKYLSAVKIGYKLLQQKTNIRVTHLTGECLVELKEFEKADSLIKKALTMQKSSKLFNLLGKIYMEAGKHKEAINYFHLASKENPDNLQGNISLARLYFKNGDPQKANKLISSLMESKPSFLDMVEIGRLYLKYAPDKAGIIFENILPINETESLFQTYANIIGKENRNQESITILKKCVEQLPASYSSHYQLGVMYLKTNNPERARPCFERTLKLKPDYGLAKEYLEKIKN